jgi:hypothetical protein
MARYSAANPHVLFFLRPTEPYAAPCASGLRLAFSFARIGLGRYTGVPSECRSGETGRRAGLKIPRGLRLVWVRFPPPAPRFRFATDTGFGRALPGGG